MIPQSRIDGNFLLVPDAGLAIPNFPVIGIVAVVNDISCDTDKGGIGLGYRLHQINPRGWICRFGIGGIVKSSIAVYHEAKRRLDIESQVDGRSLDLRCRLLRASGECQNRGHCEQHNWPFGRECTPRSHWEATLTEQAIIFPQTRKMISPICQLRARP